MSKLGIIVLVLILGLVITGLVIMVKNYDGLVASPLPSTSPSPTPTATPVSDLIEVDYPQSGELVDSPLTVYGQAHGTWYFEAVFPVKLLDATGKVIATGQAQADEEWMTEGFVPFTAKLIFSTPATATGTLLLENDNPSGDSAKSQQLSIPVVFSLSAE